MLLAFFSRKRLGLLESCLQKPLKKVKKERAQPKKSRELFVVAKSPPLRGVWTAFWEHEMQERHDLLLRMCWSDTISTWYDKTFIENIY